MGRNPSQVGSRRATFWPVSQKPTPSEQRASRRGSCLGFRIKRMRCRLRRPKGGRDSPTGAAARPCTNWICTCITPRSPRRPMPSWLLSPRGDPTRPTAPLPSFDLDFGLLPLRPAVERKRAAQHRSILGGAPGRCPLRPCPPFSLAIARSPPLRTVLRAMFFLPRPRALALVAPFYCVRMPSASCDL